MLPVVAHIAQQKRMLAKHPFLAFVKNDDHDPLRRLSFAPCLAPFVMGFSDVNVLGLRDDSMGDRLQSLVNEHTREDDHHWPMYLDDLETLGLSQEEGLTATLRGLWGADSTRTRQLTYGLMTLSRSAEPALRIALVEAIEATGFVAWRAFVKAARAYTAQTGKALRYFGPEHAALESGHAMGADDIDRELRAINLTPEQRERAIEMVDEVFALFAAMFDEQLSFTERVAA